MNRLSAKKPVSFLRPSMDKAVMYYFLIFSFSIIAAQPWLSSADAETAIPKLEGPVNDLAHVIPPTFARRIAAVSDTLFQKAGVSMMIVTVPDTGRENFERFANLLYSRWEMEKKGENRGILFFVAVKEKKMCIKPGHALEGVLPDALAKEMQDQHILPYLKRDQFGEGLLAGAIAIAKIVAYDAGVSLDGKIFLKPLAREKSREDNFQLIILAVIAFLIIAKRRAGS